MRGRSKSWMPRFTLIGGIMIYIYAQAQDMQTEEPPSAHPEYVMQFERMGGYLGVHDQFFIYPDGHVINASGKTAKVSPDTVMDWMKSISAATTHCRDGTPLSLASYCFDCFVYRITFYDRDGTKTLSLMDPFQMEPKGALIHFEGMRDRIMRLFGN